MPISEHCKAFLDWLISRHLLVKVSPEIQYLVNTNKDKLYVTLINNYENIWKGDIVPVKKGLKLKRGEDLWNNKLLSPEFFRDGALNITCPAFSFRVLSLETV